MTVEAKARRERERQARKEILAPVATTLSVAGLIYAVASVCAVVPFLLIVSACRELLGTPVDTDRVWRLLLIAVLVLVARALLQAAVLTWTHSVDAGYQLTLRRLLAAKLTRVPLGWFGIRTSSEVKKYLHDDVEALHYLVAHARLDFVGGVTIPLVTLIYLFTVDWRLALALLVPLVIYALCMRVMMDEAGRERILAYNLSEQRTREATVEFVDGIQVVRAFGRAGKAHSDFQDAVEHQTESLRRFKMPYITVQSISDAALSPVFVMLLVVLAGLTGVGAGWIEPLDVLPFLLVGLGLGSSLMGLGYAGQALRTAGDAALRLHELMQTPELSSRAPESGAEPGAPGAVRFDGVVFGYRADHDVLRGVDLELAPGTITALVGPSGSGKSTLAKLLPRFYDVTAGRITIGGRDIRDFPTDELYKTVGFVFQDVRLIRGSIRDNLLLGRPDADDAALETAARAAQIHERILALPRGYDSEIGVDATLSGGEAQRLSIARTLLADTPILVLDEATAFADPESEAAVQDALAALVAGRTVLVIAHRLHTITGVDRILVLDNGVLAEQGDHESLLAAGGLYRSLWDLNEEALNVVLEGSR
ncbi:ABC transporter ATP-binding protein [Nocardia yunnanensis]|uniref:ABC transporter ATP-binding protein n=1 Tax=Nocardia yunnanensis TaxID=2382165 RepID=A0A386ZKJ0_9NOCA|nr:ABC transporter ATP-binding protein [Nocardia yunnanensis]AYF77115.1 ABC transporter ATP-binding protein [Nocardia yunnanensis]